MLVILVGKSGVGKSTFAEALNCPDNLYVSSQGMIDKLRQRGMDVNHDTIHAIAKEMYAANPYWQIPLIMAQLKEKGLLILDGPRQTFEVRRLMELHADTLVVMVDAESFVRYKRLEGRDSVGFEEFERIEKDEAMETGLGEVFEMVDLRVENNGSLEHLQGIARRFGRLFLSANSVRR